MIKQPIRFFQRYGGEMSMFRLRAFQGQNHIPPVDARPETIGRHLDRHEAEARIKTLRVLAGVHAHPGHSRHGTDDVQARLRQRAAQPLPMQILRHHAPAQAGDGAVRLERMAAAGDDARRSLNLAFDDQVRVL